MFHFMLSLISLPRHKHEFVLQFSQILKVITANLLAVVMVLLNLEFYGLVKI